MTELTGLLRRYPACRKVYIRVALRTDGVSPVTKAKIHRKSIVISTLKIFSFPLRKKSILNMKRLRIIA